MTFLKVCRFGKNWQCPKCKLICIIKEKGEKND